MSGVRNNLQLFNLSRGIGRLLALGLALCAISFAVTAHPVKPVTTQDQKQAAAQTKYAEAKALQKEGSDESLHAALVKYGEALQLWKEVNDPAKIAKTLRKMGDVCLALNDDDRGVEYYKQTIPFSEAAGDFIRVGTTYFMLGAEDKGLNYLMSALYEKLDNKEKAMEFRKKAEESQASQRP